MGSRKKLVLASLVSLMMALAFIIGLMPLHGALQAEAAGSEPARINMVDLLNAVLNFQGGQPATDIAVTKPEDGAVFLVPADTDQAFINFQATAAGDASPVAYAINPDLTDGDVLDLMADTPLGVAFAFQPPFNAALDVQTLLGPLETSFSVYAFANAALDEIVITDLVYSVRSLTPTEFSVLKVTDADPDENGIPAPLTSVIGAGGQWRASYLQFVYDDQGNVLDVANRNVAIGSLNEPLPLKQAFETGVTVSPEPGVFVGSPTYDQLFNAGLMYENELGYIIVASSTALQLMVDDIYGGDSTAGGIAAWANGVEDVAPPGGRVERTVPGEDNGPAPYVEIALLAFDTASDTYRELETLPEDLPVELQLSSLVLDDAGVQLWSYPSWLIDVTGLEDFIFQSVDAAAGIYEWDFIAQRDPDMPGQAADSFIAEITSLSIFGAFESAMSIYKVYPDSGSTCLATIPGINIVGSFGVDADVSAQDLETQFDVFFGDQLAEIVSASETYGGDPDLVSFTVDAPGSLVPQTVDVSVVDTTVPANLALLQSAFTYYDIFTLELVPAANGQISANPLQDTYLAGDVVNLIATANENYLFQEWTGDVANVDDVNDASTTLEFGRNPGDTCDDLDLQISAQFVYFQPITEYFLDVTVDPPDAGVVNQNPVGSGPFAPDTVVGLTAVADTGYVFDRWLGPVADPNSATTSVTMAGTDPLIEVTAVFVPVFYTLTVIEDPDEGGDVTVVPVQATYLPTDSVTLTAVANPGWTFSAWVIDEEEIVDDQNPLLLEFEGRPRRDVIVRAVFTQNPILTILETVGGTVDFSPPGINVEVVNGNTLVEYFAGTDVTLTANADAEFEFVQWEIDGIVVTENPTTFAIDTDTTVNAVFTTTNFFITEVTPDASWFFGGVKARVTGGGFIPQRTQLLVYGTPVDPIAITETEIWFIVPPLPVPPANQSLLVDVTVSNPPYTVEYSESVDFLYRRYETIGDVTTTAFQFDADDGTLSIPVALGASLADAGLVLPPPEQAVDFAYGLVRATHVPALIEADEITGGPDSALVTKALEFDPGLYEPEMLASKQNTEQLDSWVFGIHLYDPTITPDELNTEGLRSDVYEEIADWSYPRDEDTDPALLWFTVADTSLEAADIRNTVSMWSVDTLYEFGLDITSLTEVTASDYQSTLTQTEVTPNVLPDSPVGTTPITSVTSRLYDLSAFALIDGPIVLPDALVDPVYIADADPAGPATGGTEFTIVAPDGGFAWVTVGFADEITETTPASATVLGNVIDNGATEFSIVVQTPEFPPTDQNTTVDVAVYLNGQLDEPVVIFDDGFRFEAVEDGICRSLLLLLLGLAAALIGLAAGGDSGGGGGPCFIATAAYGTPMAADIDTLRAFRDAYLLESSVGTALVDAYYSVSPAVAAVIAKSPVLAAGVRLLLLPVVFAAKCLLAMPAVSMLVLGVGLVLARIRRRGKAKA